MLVSLRGSQVHMLAGAHGPRSQGMAEGCLQVQVNGEVRKIHAGGTLGDLLRELDVCSDRIAVELNTEIVDRQEFDRRGLCEGDQIEIISFVGGGAGG